MIEIDDKGRCPTNNKFFRMAYKLAKRHVKSGPLVAFHSALLVRGGAVISSGVNTSKRHVICKVHGYEDFSGVHAELAALIAGRKKTDLTGCTAYVVRVLKDGTTLGMSKPCDRCEMVLRKYGIKKVYFTTENGMFDVLKLN